MHLVWHDTCFSVALLPSQHIYFGCFILPFRCYGWSSFLLLACLLLHKCFVLQLCFQYGQSVAINPDEGKLDLAEVDLVIFCGDFNYQLFGFSWEDMRLALGLAGSVSQSTPIAAAANEIYKVAKSRGQSDHDFSAVIEALNVKD